MKKPLAWFVLCFFVAIPVFGQAADTQAGIRRSDYREISIFDYRIEAEQAQMDDVRKYRSTVKFSEQNDLPNNAFLYSFECPDSGEPLSFRVRRRFPSLAPGQQITIYYTATKGVVDSLTLDDIEF